jgi:hypothetical protein
MRDESLSCWNEGASVHSYGETSAQDSVVCSCVSCRSCVAVPWFKSSVICEISGSHGGEYDDNSLLVYSAV